MITAVLDRLTDLAGYTYDVGAWAVGSFAAAVWLCGCWAILCLLVGCLRGAPLPAPRPLAFKAGEYELVWRGGTWQTRFHAGGDYEAWTAAGPTRWHGTWHVAGGHLHVGEGFVPADLGTPFSPSCRWSMKLPAGPDGLVGESKAVISIRRVK